MTSEYRGGCKFLFGVCGLFCSKIIGRLFNELLISENLKHLHPKKDVNTVKKGYRLLYETKEKGK